MKKLFFIIVAVLAIGVTAINAQADLSIVAEQNFDAYSEFSSGIVGITVEGNFEEPKVLKTKGTGCITNAVIEAAVYKEFGYGGESVYLWEWDDPNYTVYVSTNGPDVYVFVNCCCTSTSQVCDPCILHMKDNF